MSKHAINISQDLVDLSVELRRYYYGDFQNVDSDEWVKNVDRLNLQIANLLMGVVFDQVQQVAGVALD